MGANLKSLDWSVSDMHIERLEQWVFQVKSDLARAF
jgi:hypothetical protein